MKEKKNKELIAYISEALREHSEPYKEGAWERFVEKNKKKPKVVLWPYLSGAAAVLILGCSLYLLYNRVPDARPVRVDVSNKYNPEKQGKAAQDGFDVNEQSNGDTAEPEAFRTSSPKSSQTKRSAPDISVARTTDRSLKDSNERYIKGYDVSGGLELSGVSGAKGEPEPQRESIQNDEREETFPSVVRKRSQQETLAYSQPSERVSPENQRSRKNWDFGIVFSPAITNVERINLGGGVSIAYHLSEKLSIGSGISVVDLGLQQMADNLPLQSGQFAAAAVATGDELVLMRSAQPRELLSVNTNLLGLDVPIDLKYHLSDRFYASAGISLFTVLNESRVNNFLTPDNAFRNMDQANAYNLSQQAPELLRTSEPAAVTPYEGNSYSGFLNFSVGHRLPLSKKVGLSVEPFFKLPVGTLSRQDMDLRYGGLRVITNF